MRVPGLILLVGGAVLAPTAMADPLDGFEDRVVRCESRDGGIRECAADTRGGVRLLRQLSRSECVEGESWGRLRGGVWVGHGCRAEFLVNARRAGDDGDRHHGGDGFLRCESREGRSNRCTADTRRGVELMRQLSRTACIRGQNWGWDDRGVWVSGGCRAEFRTRADGGYRRATPPPAIVRCESDDGRAEHCRVDVRGEVRLVRQLSRSACIEGDTWGADRRGLWVDRGCRADFEITPHDPGERWGRR